MYGGSIDILLAVARSSKLFQAYFLDALRSGTPVNFWPLIMSFPSQFVASLKKFSTLPIYSERACPGKSTNPNSAHPLISVSPFPLLWFAPEIHNTLLHLFLVSVNSSCCPPLFTSNDPNSRREEMLLPNQNLSQYAGHLLINPLLRTRKLNVHVTVDANQPTLVFSLAPFQSDDDLLVNSTRDISNVSRSQWLVGSCEGTYKPWSIGRGLMGMNCA